jgi:hypothetical protein
MSGQGGWKAEAPFQVICDVWAKYPAIFKTDPHRFHLNQHQPD